ncbi:hypothetical protein BC332_25521 [Capsicum chinense]|nr:hypothetical protein BC332_25521 [Capsicum chinense]
MRMNNTCKHSQIVQVLCAMDMPRFKCIQKKQKSDMPVSTSQGTESACLPTNLPPSIQYAPQPSQPVYSASHPTLIDQDMPHLAPTVCLESQLTRSVHLTSHPFLVGWESSQPSRSVHSTSYSSLANQDSLQSSLSIHSTSHSDPANKDSSQAAPTDQAVPKKYSRRESNVHWVIDAIGTTTAGSPMYFLRKET